MQITWSLVQETVSVVGTLGALILGVIGLSTWRRQLKGTAEYEIAKKALLLTYQVQDAIRAARAPMVWLRQEEVEAGRGLQEEQRVYEERLGEVYKKWSGLRTVALEAKVIWGHDAESSFSSLSDCIGKLRGAIWMHFWLKGAYAGPAATVDRNPERVMENDQVVYAVSDEDPYSQEVLRAVEHVTQFFQLRVRA